MPQVTLAKALKLKNRQIQKVSELKNRIHSHNKYAAGSPSEIDAPALYEELQREIEKLWKLKAAINAANAPVQDVIYESAELKSLVAYIRKLETKQGPVSEFMGGKTEMVAQLTLSFTVEKAGRLEARIDEIQDHLDHFNASTKIEVSD